MKRDDAFVALLVQSSFLLGSHNQYHAHHAPTHVDATASHSFLSITPSSDAYLCGSVSHVHGPTAFMVPVPTGLNLESRSKDAGAALATRFNFQHPTNLDVDPTGMIGVTNSLKLSNSLKLPDI